MSQLMVNVGLIGVGRIGQMYLHHIRSLYPHAQLGAIADIAPRLTAEVASRYNIARYYTDSFDLLDDPSIDAVVIASPTDTHKELVLAASRQHKSIFCEKPPALTITDAQEMADRITADHTLCQLGFMRRFDEGYAGAKRLLDEGTIGKPILFKSTSRDQFPPAIAYLNPHSSGGLCIDMGIHDFDLARWLVGEIKAVTAVGGVLAVEDLVTVIVQGLGPNRSSSQRVYDIPG